MKPIIFTLHAKLKAAQRGCLEEEVKTTILTQAWELNEMQKFECRMNFEFNNIWNKNFYTTKQVRPIFVEEETQIVVITVYTYYF
jgi:hypothetical protein